MGKAYNRLTYGERLIIEKLYKKNMRTSELEELAGVLNRNRTTLLREIQNNTENGKNIYNAKKAQQRAIRERGKRLEKLTHLQEERKQKIQDVISNYPELTLQEVADIIGCSKTTVAKYYKNFKEQLRKKAQEEALAQQIIERLLNRNLNLSLEDVVEITGYDQEIVLRYGGKLRSKYEVDY